MKSTDLDVDKAGYIRVRVHGRAFDRDNLDILRLFFDTSRSSAGPDYAFTWNLGRYPGGRAGYTDLSRSNGWKLGRTKSCSGIRKSVSHATSTITVEIRRSCLGSPAEVRWSGFTGRVDKIERNQLSGAWDDFPKAERLPDFWAEPLI